MRIHYFLLGNGRRNIPRSDKARIGASGNRTALLTSYLQYPRWNKVPGKKLSLELSGSFVVAAPADYTRYL
jgi:hypothetical protein